MSSEELGNLDDIRSEEFTTDDNSFEEVIPNISDEQVADLG